MLHSHSNPHSPSSPAASFDFDVAFASSRRIPSPRVAAPTHTDVRTCIRIRSASVPCPALPEASPRRPWQPPPMTSFPPLDPAITRRLLADAARASLPAPERAMYIRSGRPRLYIDGRTDATTPASPHEAARLASRA
ncbi:hypothetical protein A0H81_06161 [Grifola frondosa]|uniref:Uncharacterized protein n=1 Tax=Grifola frondosa TaxID=5627 RepID=A0A1C7MAV6_GRIFR|nr:hypothetical protein A0H81_06161 [Grifola frondosa]